MNGGFSKIKDGAKSMYSKAKVTTAATVDQVRDSTLQGFSSAQSNLTQQDLKKMAEKSAEHLKEGAEKAERVAKHLWTIEMVRNAVAGGVIGAALGAVLGSIFLGVIFVAKIGFVVGAIFGLIKK